MEEITNSNFNPIESENSNMIQNKFKFSHFGIELYFYLDLFTMNKDDYKVVVSSKDYFKIINVVSIVWYEKYAEFTTEIFSVTTESERMVVCFKNVKSSLYYRNIKLSFGKLPNEELILTVRVDYEKQL